MKKSITVELDLKVMKILEKRAKERFLTVKELIEDTVRRSTVSYKSGKKPIKVDDRLVSIFSRQKSGRKRKIKK